MSNKPYQCSTCNLPCRCDRVTAIEQNREDLFGVVWNCPQCGDSILIVSPTGPLSVPTPAMCLNCGREGYAEDRPCSHCGFSLSQAISGEEQEQTDEALLKLAREAFALGAYRRGLTLVNFILGRTPDQREAWSIKGTFFETLGFRVALKTAQREAVRQTRPGT